MGDIEAVRFVDAPEAGVARVFEGDGARRAAEQLRDEGAELLGRRPDDDGVGVGVQPAAAAKICGNRAAQTFGSERIVQAGKLRCGREGVARRFGP